MIDSFRGKYAFLSNFYPFEIEYEGIKYPSTEHAYQAAKTADWNEKRRIAALPTPADAKRAGKLLNLQDIHWTKERRMKVMEDLLVKKFWQTSLSAQLKDTGTEELVEGNTWKDTFWGRCEGAGHNHLGKLLMHIRSQLLRSPSLEYRP